jgi:hypothetical protein
MPLTMPVLNRLPRRESTAVPRSQTERLWLVAGGLIALVLILIGYLFFISPQRSQTSDVNAQVLSAQDQNLGLQARIATLRQQSANLKTYEAELAKAQLALPTSSGVSDFVRTMQTIGNATLTNVTSVTIGEPAAVAAAVPTTPVATDTATASATPAAPTTPAAPSAYSMSISATVTGSPSALDNFLDQLQAVQPRAVLINQITESSNATGVSDANNQTSLQLSMQAFVSPSAQAPSPAPSGTSS